MMAAKRVQILGTGCPKCMSLAANAEVAAAEAGIDVEIEKVTDVNQMMQMGIMVTPALVIDGQVKAVGKVPSVAEIKAMLAE